ncbi:MAG: fused DSP-PTPase phosphatase/NAD kinase-like protein [Acidimicrobiales bacterium]
MVVKVVAGAVAFLVVGNLAILGASALARGTTPTTRVDSVTGIDHLEKVDAKLWRGGAPSDEGYQALAAAGATTVIDLRAEDGLRADGDTVTSLGMTYVMLPIRDGQTPSPEQVRAFLDAVEAAPGRVFVHCGAGVGRTGTMAGAYLVASGGLNGRGAVRRNLAVGPPSLEQIAFVAGLAPGDLARPNVTLRAVSRVLDAPRRIWARWGF